MHLWRVELAPSRVEIDLWRAEFESDKGNPAARHIWVWQLWLRGAWLHGLWGCMRGTEIYILHGFQVVRSVKIKESRNTSLTEKPPPHENTVFLQNWVPGGGTKPRLSPWWEVGDMMGRSRPRIFLSRQERMNEATRLWMRVEWVRRF